MAAKKIYRGHDFKSPLLIEEVATLPEWQLSDRRRIVRAVDTGKIHFGGASAWQELSQSDHNHAGVYAAVNHDHAGVYAAASHTHAYSPTTHSHAVIPNGLTVQGNLVSTGDTKGNRYIVGATVVINSAGQIDYSRIINHPSYCATNCQCDCVSNCNCNCSDNA